MADSTGARYLYGLERIGVQQDGAWSYPLSDALGSVRQWTDADGGGADPLYYDPFGVPLPQPNTPSSPFGYTGEWTSAATGLQYLRARWYDPVTGRFTQVDPFPGVLSLPGTLNPYPYALNNPLRYTDPSGEIAWMVAAPIIGGIVGAATYGATLAIGRSTREFNWRDLGTATAMGAATGVLLATGTPMGIAAALAGLSSAASQVLVDEGCFDWPTLAGMYVNGAVAAAIGMALPASWGSKLWVGAIVGSLTGVAGDVSGRITTRALLALSETDDAKAKSWKDTMTESYADDIWWGGGFGLFGVGLNRVFGKYLGRTFTPLSRESQKYLSLGAQRQSTAMSMFRQGMDGPLARRIAIRGWVQQQVGKNLLKESGTLVSNLIMSTFNSNYGLNIHKWSTRTP